MTEDSERLRVVEVVLWGADGQNGLRSELKDLKVAVQYLGTRMEERFDRVAATSDERDAQARTAADADRKDHRNTLLAAVAVGVTFLGVIVSGLVAFLSQTGHA